MVEYGNIENMVDVIYKTAANDEEWYNLTSLNELVIL